MATVSYIEKARQRRLNALASLGTADRSHHRSRFTSIFDNAFDANDGETPLIARNNVVAFRSTRHALVAANDNDTAAESAAA
ncbi:hypothetical protein [Sinisalibacter aestuarii]|uniref:Uncharacterized protein n=1 Tax=Sinisalibacter aestuarii TaxID=2949426 RepID=A0ABQ5LMN8_9RHOB|nr:hypothetical protein [Sinisalibacter aestuarii]GKY86279.1 hypothetical protein STA1M1_01480 [Sinisalibacter aestuarii]